MEFVLALLLLIPGLEPNLERVFQLIESGDWGGAAIVLDQVVLEDPEGFAANNLHYLRGRVAANQKDWSRARSEFAKVSPDNPLRTLAMWQGARAAAELRDDNEAESLLRQLPADFPADLKLQIARVSTEALAMTIYEGLQTREARFERARLQNDTARLWSLLRERRTDDIALRAAELVADTASTARQHKDLGDAFLAHRQFPLALRHYENTSPDPVLGPEAHYQIGRVHFLSEQYTQALESYRTVAKLFPGTKWEKDADYQIANCYWRLGDYKSAEKAYLEYIERHARLAVNEGAVRNLVDVYRVLGENQKALTLLDRTLARKLTTGARQAFLFTKAKILYAQKKYSSALQIFQQLGRMRLTATPNGTTTEEVRYFQAMAQSGLGNDAAANSILRSLASKPSYYGQKAAIRLGLQPVSTAAAVCASTNTLLQSVMNDLMAARRPLRTAPDPQAGAVAELTFLQLWDDAALWAERSGSRPDNRTAAQLAYLAGRFHRSIAFADRLPATDTRRQSLLYPSGFSQTICEEARSHDVDPLWLQAIIWQESKYNPNALSGAAARGLMQFIPETARSIGASIGVPELSLDQLYDPALNIRLGARYWASLMAELKSPEMALAAYNGGIDNVRRWKNKWPDGTVEFFVSDIGFTETKNYVMSVFAARAAYVSLSQGEDSRQ
jgi:soluble lytic murein transglycosylase-like protein